MEDLTYPIEILKKEITNLQKHGMFKNMNEFSYEEKQYHLLKMSQVFSAIDILQKKYIENHDLKPDLEKYNPETK